MTIAALIVAAGRGTRAGAGAPKQWRALAGRRVIDHTLAVFSHHPDIDVIALVLHPDDMDLAAGLSVDVIATGGADRATSVLHGLASLSGHSVEKVLIHDVARPCVSRAVIDAVIAGLRDADAVAPAVAVTDALWLSQDGKVCEVRDRTGLYRAQTPQGFDYSRIVAAHDAHKGGAADDVEVARAAGMSVTIVSGDEDNLKITMPADFARAERILGTRMDIRLGNGFDVHAFGPGDHVTLCGVAIPHDHGLIGHSDADVAMHTVTDAIYGALAMGDIGQHFPPSDPQWKGAASHIFLEHAVALAREHGFAISNVDCTLICELPKIGPHADDMRRVMARFLGIEEARVSVKATTSEGLGFTGRKEGIACLATASLVRS